ncbi:MAG: shikimate kinase [Clostridiales bacterium]|nr:shikimate kinase [Clostridiales bacterium]
MTDIKEGNIILIGMPGSGKSTIGVLLAKALGADFTDTDLLIQRRAGMLLKDIISHRGTDGFLDYEAEILLSLNIRGAVIATGGSAVCREGVIDSLKSGGISVWLDVPLNLLEERIGGLEGLRARGVALGDDQSLRGVYEKRRELYIKNADIRAECGELNAEGCCALLLSRLSAFKAKLRE